MFAKKEFPLLSMMTASEGSATQAGGWAWFDRCFPGMYIRSAARRNVVHVERTDVLSFELVWSTVRKFFQVQILRRRQLVIDYEK